MKIIIINGSPRAEAGNTHVISKAFSAGAESAGATVEHIFLAHHQIAHCKGCLACWKKTPGKCVIQDDAPALVQRLYADDVDMWVFATPLYVDCVTGQMKTFMDRLIMAGSPMMTTDEQGETRHISTEQKTLQFGVISNCGFPEQSHFDVLKLFFRRVARNFSAEVAFEIYRSVGPLLQINDPESPMDAVLKRYREQVFLAGKQVVETGSISKDLMADLEQPLISAEAYRAHVNAMFGAQQGSSEQA